MLIDVRRAHFNSAARRKVFLELPAEACTDKSKIGRLLRSMCGCRDAGVYWEFAICQVMIAICSVQGRASPCICRHLERQLRVWVRGDDIVPSVASSKVFFFFFESAGVLGCHELRNPRALRVPRLCAEHPSAGPLRKSFGVTGRSVATPGVRDKTDDMEGEVSISKEAADRYRASTMRAQYLTSDRPDIQVECWDLARRMQQASNLDEMGLLRLARFLEVRPRLVWLVKWQKRVARIESRCDTDHAGCIRTKQSVSGCALMLGDSSVCTYCKGQAVIALSSGEAECCGSVSAPSKMLGLQSILLDWGWTFGARVWMHATGAFCDWEPTRARTSETHRHSVPLGAKQWSLKVRSRLAGNLPKRFLRISSRNTVLNCMTGLCMQFQSGESNLTKKA